MRPPTIAAVALLVAAPLAACDAFCEDADLSCGGAGERADPECSTATGRSCTDVGVEVGLYLVAPVLPDGTYAIEGTADGQPLSCTETVAAGVPSVHCDAGASPYSLGEAIEFRTVPCSVQLQLRQGETVLLDQTIRPHYEWDEPWGEGCNWRGYARVQLVVPAAG